MNDGPLEGDDDKADAGDAGAGHAGSAGRPLRSGWTTGTCAAAAAAAAWQAWLTGGFPDQVTVRLPRGGTATLPLARAELGREQALAGVIKDSGDDPDVTHGCEVVVTVAPAPPGAGIVFRGGEGVGRVTLPGLPLAVGEPAINPGPRAMIADALAAVATMTGEAMTRGGATGPGPAAGPDVIVTIAVPGGEALATRTLNGRLGILGGLSILGTTGIVVPFSCAAWIHSIHRGIDVARAARLAHLAAATGSVSEAAVRALYGLPELALIDMGDFIGGTLKYLRSHTVPRLSLAGGFGKLAKLAQGHLYVHSSRSRIDIERLAGDIARLGGDGATVAAARQAVTAAQVHAIAGRAGVPLAAHVAGEARRLAAEVLAGADIDVEVLVYDRQGRLLARSPWGGKG
ncbi:MAG: cobalt-precorrin-5B (C(1))-methyltransferase [Rhodospirillales bacterium]